MKKLTSILLIALLTLSVMTVLASCGNKTQDSTDTKETIESSAVANDTMAETDDTEASESDTEEETEAPAPITEGTITISDLVTIELKDGWYSEEGLDTTWNSVKLENKEITDFLASVSVSVGNVYGDDHAKEWADNIQGNYGGKGSISTEEIAGLTFYHLSGVVDDDTQNIYFADLDDEHYLEVDIMFMDVNKGLPAFDLLSFNK